MNKHSEFKALEKELEQQCLLLGKSGSREAKLLAEIERLRKLVNPECEKAHLALEAEAQRMREALEVMAKTKCYCFDINGTAEDGLCEPCIARAALTTPQQEGKGKE